jgi:glycosyltransferase involved in cell wall biosynthesis
LELGRTRRHEGWLVDQFDRVLVTSQTDKTALESLRRLRGESRISVLPNGVDLDHFAAGNGDREPATLVFSGKMSYHANATAALYVANEVMPLVWARRPDVRLRIAGSRPPAQVRRLAENHDGRVEVTGYVPDMRVPLQQATVAVAPLLYGAGIQNKVLEAMACGAPVVTSSRAVAALRVRPGVDCLVADTPQAFAAEIVRLLDDAGLRQRMTDAARRYVEMNHSWGQVAAQLEAIYREASDASHADRKAS